MKMAFSLALLSCVSVVAASEALPNGDFEAGAVGWSFTERSGGNQIQVASEAGAPSSGSGLHLSVQEEGELPPLATRSFDAEIKGASTLSFDFCVTDQTTYTGGDGVLLIRFSSPGSDALRPIFLVRGDGKVALGSTLVPGLQWNRGTWYSVTISLPAPGKQGAAKVQMKAADGSPQEAVVDGFVYPSPEALTEFSGIQIQTGYGQRPVTDVFVDNLSLKPLT